MRTHDMHAHRHVQVICCLANGGKCGVVGFRVVDLATQSAIDGAWDFVLSIGLSYQVRRPGERASLRVSPHVLTHASSRSTRGRFVPKAKADSPSTRESRRKFKLQLSRRGRVVTDT